MGENKGRVGQKRPLVSRKPGSETKKSPRLEASGSIHLWRRVEETTSAWECPSFEKF